MFCLVSGLRKSRWQLPLSRYILVCFVTFVEPFGAICPALIVWELTPTMDKCVYTHISSIPEARADGSRAENLPQTRSVRLLGLRIWNLSQSSRTDPAIYRQMLRKARRRRRRGRRRRQTTERKERPDFHSLSKYSLNGAPGWLRQKRVQLLISGS